MITVTLFDPGDWAEFKAVRLLALRSDPAVFGSNFAKEAAYDDAYWREWAERPGCAVFAVRDGGKVIGMTGIALKREDPSGKDAVLWGSWLDPAYRGRGISEKMYRARLAWAEAHPTVERIVVSHRASNLSSKKANQKHGFTFTHEEAHTWHDGVTEPQLFYEKTVKRKS